MLESRFTGVVAYFFVREHFLMAASAGLGGIIVGIIIRRCWDGRTV